MRINSTASSSINGKVSLSHLTEHKLRKATLACLLWENQFYIDGESHADQIVELAKKVDAKTLSNLAIEIRQKNHLRHVPLLLCCVLAAKGGRIVGDTIYQVVQRADEITELLAIYWKDGKKPLSSQLKIGLARAIRKFSEYELAKYNRGTDIKLRDVLFMVHAKPKTKQQGEMWKRLANNELKTPDTWEVEISAKGNQAETWTRLITEGKLGYLALLRNLRNMIEANVDSTLIRNAILARKNASRVLPFRFVAAAKYAPQFEDALNTAMLASIESLPVFPKRTVILVDTSGSMAAPLSVKSDLTRTDAAATLASMVKGDVRLYWFADKLGELPHRLGMAGVEKIRSAPSGSTRLFDAIHYVNQYVPYDRIIVLTDEEDTGGYVQKLPMPVEGTLGYMVNVSATTREVAYGKWSSISGFSENILHWMHEMEKTVSRRD